MYIPDQYLLVKVLKIKRSLLFYLSFFIALFLIPFIIRYIAYRIIMDLSNDINEKIIKNHKNTLLGMNFKKDFFSNLDVSDYKKIINSFENFLKEPSLQNFFQTHKKETKTFQLIIDTLKLGFEDTSSENFEMSFNLLKFEPIHFYNVLLITQPNYKIYDLELFHYSDLHNHLISELLNDIILSGNVTQYNHGTINQRYNVSLIGKILKKSPQREFDINNLFKDDFSKFINASSINTLFVDFSKKGNDNLILSNNLFKNIEALSYEHQEKLLPSIVDAHYLFNKAAFMVNKNNELKNASKFINNRYDEINNFDEKAILFRVVSGFYLMINNFDIFNKNEKIITNFNENRNHFDIGSLSFDSRDLLADLIPPLLQKFEFSQENQNVITFINNLKSNPLNKEKPTIKP